MAACKGSPLPSTTVQLLWALGSVLGVGAGTGAVPWQTLCQRSSCPWVASP